LVYFSGTGEELVKERCRVYGALLVVEINDDGSPDAVDFNNTQLFIGVHADISLPNRVLRQPLGDTFWAKLEGLSRIVCGATGFLFPVHSATASVQELRPSALRSELAFRALRV
jgi:hypothetical protein